MDRRVASDDPIIRRFFEKGLYVGVTAWTQPALVGEFYQPRLASPEERLRFYASRFPITDVDSTF